MVKNLPANAGDLGLILGWERSTGGGNGNPLQYSCLGSPMNRGTWRATVPPGRKESDMTEQLTRSLPHVKCPAGYSGNGRLYLHVHFKSRTFKRQISD